VRYTTQANVPGSPGNISPFRFDGVGGLANVNRVQTPGHRVPISYGTGPLMGNALGMASSAVTPSHAMEQQRTTIIPRGPEPTARAIPNVQNTIRQLAAQQGSMPVIPVASRTQGTVGGVGNSAWCN
jgi:hypothetical protein